MKNTRIAGASVAVKNVASADIEPGQVARSPHHSKAASGAPRGIRNLNPLNIRHGPSRWLGLLPHEKQTDKAFCRFSAMEFGFRAAFITLRTYMRSYKLNTIEKIIYRWAPPADGNDTEKYVRDVCRLTGLPGKAPMILNDPRLKEIVWAMAQIESGNGILDHREALEKGWELAFGS